ncbi:amidohydrolase family protein [Kriegella sp. EG-1]|nr:amidohydrolase family protein [Flavobacteriaceae bacterium EG-1]
MKLIGPFKQLLPMTGLPMNGPIFDEQLVVLKDVGILIDNEIIAAIGNFEELKTLYHTADIHILQGDHTCLPGFIDTSTQLCFGGSGANKNECEIVEDTRNTTKEALAKKTAKLVNRHLKNGTTTIAVKSGFGHSVDEELKIIRAINDSQHQTLVDILAICNIAKRNPKDFTAKASSYVETICAKLLPIIKEENLTNRISVNVTNLGFSITELQSCLKKAETMGFQISIVENVAAKSGNNFSFHKDEYGFISALAGTSIGLGKAFAPARKILDNGGSLAIASDHNPITAPMGDLLTQASILCTYENLTNAEILAAITKRAATALNLNNCGELVAGNLADFILFHTNNYKDIIYNQGSFKPCVVFKKGKVAFNKHK